MKKKCLIIKRVLGLLFGCVFLPSALFAQSPYDERVETFLNYFGFSDEQRKAGLIALSDSGNPRAMYYLAIKYNHPQKSSFELIKEAAGKGYFMAELEMGEMCIRGRKCNCNKDSAYYWLSRAIEHTEPYVDSDTKLYFKSIKTMEGQNRLSIEIERMATYAVANSILSQYYIEKGQEEKGLNAAEIGYSIMDKIYLEPKGWTPNSDIYKDLLRHSWNSAIRYLAVANYATGNVKKGDKVYSKYDFHDMLLSDFEYKEPREYIIAKRIDALYAYNFTGSKSHPLAIKYYIKAVEKMSYLAMREMIGKRDQAILSKVKQLAFSGDSIAVMLYLHHQLCDEKDTIAANLFLKEIPLKLSFPYDDYKKFTSDDYILYYVLTRDDVCFLLTKDALHTDVETILRLIDRYANKFNGNTDFKKVVSLYEVLISQHPNYSPTPQLKRDVSACYYNLRDYIKAIPIMSEICDTYPDASFRIGEILYEGYLGVPDYNKAFEYLKSAENMKNDEEVSRLFYYLGMCYLKGNGVAKDEAKGFEYMKKALTCRRIYIKTFWEISKCYRFGRGVSRDLKKAEEYEEKAASYKNEDALWIREQQMQ